jgi:hypothetical protein
MGIFKRKDSKNSIPAEKEDRESFVSVNSARTSNASLKSPGYKSGALPSSIPELAIASPPDPALDPAAYLRSIHAVRHRSHIVLRKAKRNQLNHFDVDMTKFAETASYVVSIIKVSPHVPLPLTHHVIRFVAPLQLGSHFLLSQKERLRSGLLVDSSTWSLATF